MTARLLLNALQRLTTEELERPVVVVLYGDDRIPFGDDPPVLRGDVVDVNLFEFERDGAPPVDVVRIDAEEIAQ